MRREDVPGNPSTAVFSAASARHSINCARIAEAMRRKGKGAAANKAGHGNASGDAKGRGDPTTNEQQPHQSKTEENKTKECVAWQKMLPLRLARESK